MSNIIHLYHRALISQLCKSGMLTYANQLFYVLAEYSHQNKATYCKYYTRKRLIKQPGFFTVVFYSTDRATLHFCSKTTVNISVDGPKHATSNIVIRAVCVTKRRKSLLNQPIQGFSHNSRE